MDGQAALESGSPSSGAKGPSNSGAASSASSSSGCFSSGGGGEDEKLDCVDACALAVKECTAQPRARKVLDKHRAFMNQNPQLYGWSWFAAEDDATQAVPEDPSWLYSLGRDGLVFTEFFLAYTRQVLAPSPWRAPEPTHSPPPTAHRWAWDGMGGESVNRTTFFSEPHGALYLVKEPETSSFALPTRDGSRW